MVFIFEKDLKELLDKEDNKKRLKQTYKELYKKTPLIKGIHFRWNRNSKKIYINLSCRIFRFLAEIDEERFIKEITKTIIHESVHSAISQIIGYSNYPGEERIVKIMAGQKKLRKTKHQNTTI